MKVDTGVEVRLHSFLTSVLDGVDWLTSQPSLFTAEEEQWKILRRRQGTPRGGLDVLERRRMSCPYRDSRPELFGP